MCIFVNYDVELNSERLEHQNMYISKECNLDLHHLTAFSHEQHTESNLIIFAFGVENTWKGKYKCEFMRIKDGDEYFLKEKKIFS